MAGYSYKLNKNTATFFFTNDTKEFRSIFDDGKNWSHYILLYKLINLMKRRGWEIKHDMKVDSIIRNDYWVGSKGDLEFALHRYPLGFEFEFFQNIVFENPHGGRYDFDKYKKMPYLIKLMFINETNHMKELIKKECPDATARAGKDYVLAEDKIKADYVREWFHPQKSMEEFSLSDLDGQTDKQTSNIKDRDKKTIYNGEMKYFRDWGGRLCRGKVYHNINNMWWVILNDFDYSNVSAFNLFDATPDDFKVRRLRQGHIPTKVLEQRKTLADTKTKELLQELKRRGCKLKAVS